MLGVGRHLQGCAEKGLDDAAGLERLAAGRLGQGIERGQALLVHG